MSFADGNGDGIVDAADYAIWRKHYGTTGAGGFVLTPIDRIPAVTAPEPAATASKKQVNPQLMREQAEGLRHNAMIMREHGMRARERQLYDSASLLCNAADELEWLRASHEPLPQQSIDAAAVDLQMCMETGYGLRIEAVDAARLVKIVLSHWRPSQSPLATGCHRSHPHEDMSAECERLTAIARENNRRANEPPPGCAQCSNVAPIAKLTVRDGLAVRAGLYAPGLPDGDHDVSPAASSQPPADDRCQHDVTRSDNTIAHGEPPYCRSCDRIVQFINWPAQTSGINEKVREWLYDWCSELSPQAIDELESLIGRAASTKEV